MIVKQGIPPELISREHWVCWKYQLRNSKRTKIPLQPDGRPASSTDSATWHSFAACYAAAFRYSGVGIVLTDGLAGIDLDHHVDEHGRLSDAAQCLVDRLGTYTEITPSGHGLHCLFWGKLPEGGRRNDRYGFEWYDSARYFTITGQHVAKTPTTLAYHDCLLVTIQAEVFGESTAREPQPCSLMILDDDDDLLRRAMAARNGDQFRALWHGDTSAYAGDRSRADLALCRRLAFWTSGDAARVDRLFRQSGLMRTKWDKKHYANGRTYGEATVAKVVSC